MTRQRIVRLLTLAAACSIASGCGFTVADGLACDDTHGCPADRTCVGGICTRVTDAGTDAGSPARDAGSALDAGSPARDAGSALDAGPTDAGEPPDAGPTDAGEPPDAGPPACGNGRVEPEPMPCFAAIPTRTLAVSADFVIARDMNDDTHQDLVVRDVSANTLSVLLGVGNGTFLTPLVVATDANPGDVAIGDLDADGNLDVAEAHSDGSATGVRVFYGDGAGHLTLGPTTAISPGVAGITIGNLNGDAPLDIVIGTVGDTSNVAVVYGGPGRTLMAATYLYSGGQQALVPFVLDTNGDGRQDIVMENPNRLSNGTLGVLLGQMGGGFGSAMTVGTGCIHANTFVLGDLDGDGRLDGIVGSQTNNNLCVLLANGTTFATGTVTMVTPTAPFGEPVMLATGDLDTNGNQDVLVAVGANRVVWIFRGDGDGMLGSAVSLATVNAAVSGAIADFNEDGAVDFVLAIPGSNPMGLAVYIADP